MGLPGLNLELGRVFKDGDQAARQSLDGERRLEAAVVEEPDHLVKHPVLCIFQMERQVADKLEGFDHALYDRVFRLQLLVEGRVFKIFVI